MTKIFILESEYAALKKAAQKPRLLTEKSESPTAKIDEIDVKAVQRENEDRQKTLQPETIPKEEEDIAKKNNVDVNTPELGTGECEEYEKENKHYLQNIVSFLPVEKQHEARDFLKKLILHPSVDLEHGCVLLAGNSVGHIVLVLDHLFGKRKRKEEDLLRNFLQQTEFCEYNSKSPKKSAKRKSPSKENSITTIKSKKLKDDVMSML